jgi:hypothetical protein
MAAPKPAPKRSWWMDKKHVVHCYTSPRDDCLYHVVAVPPTSGFYDAKLAQATDQISGILDGLSGQERPDMNPSVIVANGAPFLAWTQPSRVGPDEDGAITPDDDPDTIRRALGLKMESAARKKPKPRAYIIHSGTVVSCYPSDTRGCVISKFWESLDVKDGSFHDDDMADATLKLNKILDGVSPDRNPSFLAIGGALALVWTEPGVGPEEDPEVIWRALGLND